MPSYVRLDSYTDQKPRLSVFALDDTLTRKLVYLQILFSQPPVVLRTQCEKLPVFFVAQLPNRTRSGFGKMTPGTVLAKPASEASKANASHRDSFGSEFPICRLRCRHPTKMTAKFPLIMELLSVLPYF